MQVRSFVYYCLCVCTLVVVAFGRRYCGDNMDLSVRLCMFMCKIIGIFIICYVLSRREIIELVECIGGASEG